tara:strand:- start:294 stop:707 length:414 start_codon:yes stop_codon:yes gene_type:complete
MWTYCEIPFEPDEEYLKQFVGFVYLITEIDTGKMYIGKKNFWSTRRLPPLKGKKRKRTVTKQSDWREYYGSNETLKTLVEERGGDKYKREILKLCKSKGDLSYEELLEQVRRDVLRDDKYYNGIIQVRISSNHLRSE